jgi:DNA-binding response OmpR family regulator
VDDDPSIVRLLRKCLEQEGLEVVTASDGAGCLLAIESRRPDLVVLDVMMPIMDGFQVLRVLREKPETRDLPVVLLTARKQDVDVARGWSSGADFYLTKPLALDDLVLVVRRILQIPVRQEAEPA